MTSMTANPSQQVYDNVLDAIGNTPLIKLNSITSDLPCTIWAKVEFFNPGGSVKDRIGPAIIEDAEKDGRLLPGGTIIESTSGNTGVGLAIAAAIKGYKCIFVMPDKMSQEKIQLLRAFGARVVVTPTAVEPNDPRSYYRVADRLVEETPNSILANQYHNPVNPQTHVESTGPELWRQTDGKITHFVAGMGTGGTITGVGRFLKNKDEKIQVVGVDPYGSILYHLHKTGEYTEAEGYLLEGIGEDFLPSTYDMSLVDTIMQVNDRECFMMTRRLVREEGLFVGGSCGAAVAGAVKYAIEHNLGPDDNLVVLLPDSGSRYLSKIFNDDWMRENGFLESAWVENRAIDIHNTKAITELFMVKPTDRMGDVVKLLKQNNISQAPVTDDDGKMLGIVKEIDLLNHILMGDHAHSPDETIEEVIDTNVQVVLPSTPLESLMGIFGTTDVAVIATNGTVEGILTKIDILDFLSSKVV